MSSLSWKTFLFFAVFSLSCLGFWRYFSFFAAQSLSMASTTTTRRLTGQQLREFIKRSKKNSSSRIVLGNESGDLDSTVSSIIYSYFLSERSRESVCPVLNYPAKDLALRPEIRAVLAPHIDQWNDLTFIDQINLSNPSLNDVTLVDHNRLSINQSFLAPLVHTVIDHHIDESQDLLHIDNKQIEVVGSACTLITELILKSSYTMDADISRILLSAILSDTFNLSQPNERTFPKDREMAEKLAKVIHNTKPSLEVFESIFQFVQYEKSNVTSLSSNELLRKDYKQWKAAGGSLRLGISAVPLSFSDWSKKDPTFSEEFISFSNAKELDILVVMTVVNNPDYRRELSVFIQDKPELYEAVIAKLFAFDLEAVPLVLPNARPLDNERYHLSFYSTTVRYSRKKLSPILTEFLSEQ